MARSRNNGSFKKGCKAGPGRPKGSVGGRAAALARLDVMLAKDKNLKKLDRELQKAFDAGPIAFFQDIVMPLIPRSQIIKMEGDNRVPIRVMFPEPSETETKGKSNGKTADRSRRGKGSK